MKITKMAWLAIVGSTLIVSGCGSDMKKDDAGSDKGAVVEDRGDSGNSGATTQAAGEGSKAKLSPLQDPNSDVYAKTVYFAFDSSEITAESANLLRAHAAYLNSSSLTFVIVQGHADERGSREYNVALGERRAQAVRAFFTAEGVDTRQIDIVSYGEERPAERGNNEAAWAKNRRAVLAY